MNNSKLIIMILTLILLAALLVGCTDTSKIEAPENEVETQEIVMTDSDGYIHISGTRQIDDVEIKNIKLKMITPHKCEITADVKNTSNNYNEMINAELVITMKDGTVKKSGGLISAMNGQEEKRFATQVLADLTDVANIEFEKIDLMESTKEEL